MPSHRIALQRLLLAVSALLLLGCSNTPTRPQSLPPSDPPAIHLNDPATLPASVTIDLTRQHAYLFARGRVNGNNAGLMLLDTGSNITIVDTGLANRLNLPVVGEGRTRGIAGTADFEFREVDTLSLGGLGIPNHRIAALSMRQLTGGLGVSAGGLIGFNAFAQHPFTIDYPNNQLTVYRRDTFTPPVGADRVELHNYRGLPAVVATLGGGQDILLILDTGANNTVSLPSHVADWPRILATHTAGAGQARGVGGHIDVQQTWLRRLDVFGLRLADVAVTFEPQPLGLSDPRHAVGRIGGEILASFRLTFDMPNRALYIEFVPDGASDE
ncbi:MAG: aspartyl protease family protein [Phycisphaerales bacterium JB063]